MSATSADPKAIFVVGAPRSGAVLIGNFLSSGGKVVDLGAYGAFEFAYRGAPAAIGNVPGPFRDDYLGTLKVHARTFAEDRARELGRSWYCDTTPWNALVADRLASDLPAAIFILTLRHYSGAIQSARRSEAPGHDEISWQRSAARWAACYDAVDKLPPERTVVVSYESLVDDRDNTAEALSDALEELGFDTANLDRRQLTHDGPVAPPQADAHTDRSTGGFDPSRWSGDIHKKVWPVVQDVHRDMRRRFGAVYRMPTPPAHLSAHDEVAGLVPFEVDEW